ncbi:MAG: IPT/TIG domain-containing protein [Planctomycetota bacterium]
MVDSQTLVFYTVAAAPGGPHVLTVQNPGGDQTSSAFVFNSAVDPRISRDHAEHRSGGGGTEVQIYGSGFHAGVQVVFGADPYTGQGGAAASQMTVLSDSLIVAVSPAVGSAFSSVMVQG